VEEVRKLSHTVGESRRRPGVIGIAVHCHCCTRPLETRGATGGFLDPEAARSDDDELRFERECLVGDPQSAIAGLEQAWEGLQD
jgi:hypothetical protein